MSELDLASLGMVGVCVCVGGQTEQSEQRAARTKALWRDSADPSKDC